MSNKINLKKKNKTNRQQKELDWAEKELENQPCLICGSAPDRIGRYEDHIGKKIVCYTLCLSCANSQGINKIIGAKLDRRVANNQGVVKLFQSDGVTN